MKKDAKQMKKNNTKRNERGASLVEYALLVALISVAAVTVLGTIGTNANTKLSTVASSLN